MRIFFGSFFRIPALNTKLAFLGWVCVAAVGVELDDEIEANCCVCGVLTDDGVQLVVLEAAVKGVEHVLLEDAADAEGVLGLNVVSMLSLNSTR